MPKADVPNEGKILPKAYAYQTPKCYWPSADMAVRLRAIRAQVHKALQVAHSIVAQRCIV